MRPFIPPTLLAAQLVFVSASWAENYPGLEAKRISASYSFIAGCVASVVDQAVQGYMQSAAEAGKPFALVEVARVEMTSAPHWRDVIQPAIYAGCECAVAKELRAIRLAETPEAIDKVIADLPDLKRFPEESENRRKEFDRCFQLLVEKRHR